MKRIAYDQNEQCRTLGRRRRCDEKGMGKGQDRDGDSHSQPSSQAQQQRQHSTANNHSSDDHKRQQSTTTTVQQNHHDSNLAPYIIQSPQGLLRNATNAIALALLHPSDMKRHALFDVRVQPPLGKCSPH